MTIAHRDTFPGPVLALIAQAEAAARRIPPLWSLTATVAVNPFVGQADEDLATAAARLARVAGAPATAPRADLLQRVRSGEIEPEDLAAALADQRRPELPETVEALLAAAAAPATPPAALPTVAELARDATGIDWPTLVADRIGQWAAGYFDQGQAHWAAPVQGGAWAAWRRHAMRDLTPEIAGLTGFAAHVEGLHDNPFAALGRAALRLGIDGAAAETAFHRLLCDLGGWAQYAAGLRFEAAKAGDHDATLTDLLAIRLAWDEALMIAFEPQLAEAWGRVVAAHAAPVVPTPAQAIDALLQDAADRAAQRRLALRLDAAPGSAALPVAQAVFCIDVRSEVIRRALETADPGIETLGFAGFFGLPLHHQPAATDIADARHPVLIGAGAKSSAAGPDDAGQRIAARAARAWQRFKQAAVSSFAFVEATGPLHAARLISDGIGRVAPAPAAPRPRLVQPSATAERVALARGILQGMGLSQGFAPLVLIVGHGASVVNNPFQSALQCGACGGHDGAVNARLAADLLNDAGVRDGLAGTGIAIPPGTRFLAALHDTVDDSVTVFADDPLPADHRAGYARLCAALDRAGLLARNDRARTMPLPGAGPAPARGRDWAQIRPEWGLAGCDSFIAAPRDLTRGLDLGGRTFLHSYDWHQDRDLSVLTLILTAPVVVANWINLQYYGSTVAPGIFGAGDKLLHNVTGGIGVVEGAGGRLCAGLPLQSVHDGQGFVHRPLRLGVLIAAPPGDIARVLAAHPAVQRLFDNRWMRLTARDPETGRLWLYEGGSTWAPLAPLAAPLDRAA